LVYLTSLWYYSNATAGRKKVITRINSFHGATVVATSLSGLARNYAMFDLPLPGFLHTADPHFYRHGQPGETEEQYATRLVAELEALILAEGPNTIMAFLVEPVTGAGGVIIPPRTYHQKVQALLERYDILFLASSEVITDLAAPVRCSSQTLGIKPAQR
jgi:4-aminobutyrate--pyruvate transaminase